jgi:hypothetical protein
MPRPADLPDSLQPICYRHAVTIGDDPHFDDDVARLIRGLKKLLGPATDGPAEVPPAGGTRGASAATGKQGQLLAKLRELPEAASYDTDRALLNLWGDGAALAGCAEADPFRPRVEAARERVGRVTKLARAIDAADAGVGSEAAVVEAANSLVEYDHPFAMRVSLGAKTVTALGELKAAVNQTPPSDRAIAAPVDQMRATNVELLARLDRVDPALAAEAAAAVRRRNALDEFVAIPVKYSAPHDQDRKWLALWAKHKDLLHGRRDAEELRGRLTLARDRTQACEALLKALDDGDILRLHGLYEKHSVLLQGYPPLAERRRELQKLLARADQVVAIQTILASPAASLARSLPAADLLRVLRDNHALFGAADKQAIVARVTDGLRNEAKLVPGHPPVQRSPGGGGLISVRWAWPAQGVVSHCVVAVDETRHLTTPADAGPYSLLKCQLPDHSRGGGGIQVVAPRGAQKVYVTVWAVADLGWTTVYGPPLHLGPVAVGR